MSYKFSKGSQVIGDLKAADDTQRDTLIDFGQDQIEFQTSGSTRLKVENTQILTTVPLHISGSLTEGLRIAKGGSDYREIQFENDGVDAAFIQVDNTEGLQIGCQADAQEIAFWTTQGGSITEKMRIRASGKVGIGVTNPSHMLDINGDIRVRGNDIRDNSGNPAISFDGNGNVGTLQITGSVTPDEALEEQTISFYLDEGNNQLKVKVKYSDGLIKTGTIALS